MLNKANITWSVKQIVKMINNNKISFENAVQRGYEWDVKRGSLLIHSLLCGFPVPPCFAAKGENGVYDMLDGKQRMTTLKRFLNNEFALKGVPPINYEVNGTELEMDINDSKYENLPEEVKDELDSASLTIYYFDGITDDEIAEMFFRLNNGKPCSTGTIMRVRAMSKDRIREIGQHEIFNMALTKKALESFTNEDIVIKSLYILNGGNNLETKNLKVWVSENEVTPAMEKELLLCYGRLKSAVETIQKTDKKTAKKILTKTHLISLLPIISRANSEKVKNEDLITYLTSFFGVEDKTSAYNSYNECCMTGSNKTEAVTGRQKALTKAYEKMFSK